MTYSNVRTLLVGLALTSVFGGCAASQTPAKKMMPLPPLDVNLPQEDYLHSQLPAEIRADSRLQPSAMHEGVHTVEILFFGEEIRFKFNPGISSAENIQQAVALYEACEADGWKTLGRHLYTEGRIPSVAWRMIDTRGLFGRANP